MLEHVDVTVIGAGAAGLMAGIWAGRTDPNRSIVLLDGARTLGAKILIAGGGRCNVTHDHVDAGAYAGSSRQAIGKVLRRFDVPQTVAFFRELGVELKREETGKLFPITNRAESVLDSLVAAAKRESATILYPHRVDAVERVTAGFRIMGGWGEMEARCVILATGGRSLPKSGSDGHGYDIARSLGHQPTRRIFPGLVPLTLPRDHFICGLAGVAVPATLEVRSRTGKRLVGFTGPTLCAHFGLTGPAVLDISRYYIAATLDDPETTLTIDWLPGKTTEEVDAELQALGGATPLRYLRAYVPERLARGLCAHAGVEPGTPGHELPRLQRKNLAGVATRLRLPITGNRGYNYSEVTAGGIPLAELNLSTLESRVCPGLYLCGEVCDVDGRIGGFNFQWAWASGYVAGVSVGRT